MQKSYRHLQDLQPAKAAVVIANGNGFYNVTACDGENIEVTGNTFVATFGVIWLDTCDNEDGGLALLDMQIWEHVNGNYESAAAGIWDLGQDTHNLADFMNLFYY